MAAERKGRSKPKLTVKPGKPRRAKPGTAGEMIIEQRRAQVVKLRVEQALSIRAIAAKLDVSVGTVHEDLTAVLVNTREDTAERVKVEREISIGRLELAIEKIMPQVRRGNLNAADRLVRLEHRLAKLKGTDAPLRQELTGIDGTPIELSVKEGLGKKLEDLGKRLTGGSPQLS
jgi:hypothetical protein